MRTNRLPVSRAMTSAKLVFPHPGGAVEQQTAKSIGRDELREQAPRSRQLFLPHDFRQRLGAHPRGQWLMSPRSIATGGRGSADGFAAKKI
ncbi:hypothetical protein N9K67_02090 [Opitutaceae bacterium]|nr:hypothetical protein [Opitutaceae bacterium]